MDVYKIVCKISLLRNAIQKDVKIFVFNVQYKINPLPINDTRTVDIFFNRHNSVGDINYFSQCPRKTAVDLCMSTSASLMQSFIEFSLPVFQ